MIAADMASAGPLDKNGRQLQKPNGSPLSAHGDIRKMVLSVHFEDGNVTGKANARDRKAVRTALDRYAEALKLKLPHGCLNNMAKCR
jgi:hypothetical protein